MKSRFPIPDAVAYEVVFSSEQIEILHIPAVSGMMMNHLGDASHEEYKTAFLSLLSLRMEYDWKVSMTNETWLKHIPTKTRIWTGTRFAFMPGSRKIIKMNTEVVSITSKSSLGRSLAKMFHGVIHQVSGLHVYSFDTLEESLIYLAGKYGDATTQEAYASLASAVK